MLPEKWRRCVMFLIFVLCDASGMPKQWRRTATAYGSDNKMGIASQSWTRILLDFPSVADTTGLLFCVANPSADQTALAAGLNWACGPGGANCVPIQQGQPCYVANNLTAVASYAYNDYYQKNKATGATCSFNNTAVTTASDPSHGSCIFTGSTEASTNTNTSTGTNISPSPTTTPSGTALSPPFTFDGSTSSTTSLPAYLCPVLYYFLCL